MDSLRESVSSIPTPRSDEGLPPTEEERSTLGARGTPEDLSKRVRAANQLDGLVRRSRSPRPASAPRRESGGSEDQRAVTTNELHVTVMTDPVPTPLLDSGDVEEPISTTEAHFRGDFEQSPTRALTQFGYDYFASQRTALEPILPEADDDEAEKSERPTRSALPLDKDYEVRVGDQLNVSVTGTMELDEKVTVDLDGTVTLPEVGPLPVAGLSIDRVQAAIREAYERERIGIVVQVSLSRLQVGRIHVVGDVKQPGAHTVTMPAGLMDALSAAGGPSKNGSLRKIRIDRLNGKQETVDLYGLLMGGQRITIAPLQDGDIVSVPPIGATAGIAGSVQRPAIYEMDLPASVQDIVDMAGGLTPFTFQTHLQLERTTEGRGREILDITMDAAGMRTLLRDGDLLLIGAINNTMRSLVRIEGEVVRPGDFQYREGMHLSELLALADGLQVSASVDQAIVSRQVGPKSSIEIISGTRTQESSRRRLVVDLSKALAGHPEHDIVLEPLDHVTIQSRSDTTIMPTVEIIGAVQRPGTFELTGQLHATDLIALAGNLLPNAFMEEAELVRNVYDEQSRQMSVERMRINLSDALEGGGSSDPRLVHGDRLVVRQLKESYVTVEIEGEVRFPGTYVFPATSKITDLIAAAGGLLPQADIRASKFSRASVRDLQNKRFRELAEFIREQAEANYTRLVQVGSPQEGVAGRIALDHTRELIGRMASYQPDGRIVIPWITDDFPSSIFNLTLEDGDTLRVAKQHQTVSVVGHVFNSGAFVAFPGLNVQALIDQCGGVTDQGDVSRVYVIRADGMVQLVRGGRGSVAMYPGDVLMVPRQKLRRTLMAQVTDALHMLRAGAETGLLLNNLEQVDLGVNWVSGSTSRPEYRVSDGLFD